MASHVAKLQQQIAELRRHADAAVQHLGTIRVRTSRVLDATRAFSALSSELALLSRSLWSPVTIERLSRDAAERLSFQAQVCALHDRLEALRRRYASELPPPPAPPPPSRKRWWQLLK